MKTIELNEQQIELIIEALNELSQNYSNTYTQVAQQIINKLEEK